MWYAKMYFSGEKEFFENDAFGMQGLPSKQLELPFLESLLTFLELDEKEIKPMLERISVNWERFVESRAREAYTAAMVELGVLAEKHIYFRLLYTLPNVSQTVIITRAAGRCEGSGWSSKGNHLRRNGCDDSSQRAKAPAGCAGWHYGHHCSARNLFGANRRFVHRLRHLL